MNISTNRNVHKVDYSVMDDFDLDKKMIPCGYSFDTMPNYFEAAELSSTFGSFPQ